MKKQINEEISKEDKQRLKEVSKQKSIRDKKESKDRKRFNEYSKTSKGQEHPKNQFGRKKSAHHRGEE